MSYFDDALRDQRRYGIENTAYKVRRPGAVRRSHDAVCTERILFFEGHDSKTSAKIDFHSGGASLRRTGEFAYMST